MARRAPAHDAAAAVFSDRFPVAEVSALIGEPTEVPRARAVSPGTVSRGGRGGGRIAQRNVPDNQQPDALHRELIELGDAFRAYQQLTEPDLALLAALLGRKARAFAQWAEVTGTPSLRHEADRALKATQTPARCTATAPARLPLTLRAPTSPRWKGL
ncbi:hypothetical protein ACIQU6_27770 [Streptomyces sp. NPDC090442]|uniref:hypothetical protein n=1 Tax=Streptomyces sp. NPDC090442 TaxID=3365962 RepID=UPI0037F7FD7F